MTEKLKLPQTPNISKEKSKFGSIRCANSPYLIFILADFILRCYYY